jgi:membrane-associated phospholipid phosphatase
VKAHFLARLSSPCLILIVLLTFSAGGLSAQDAADGCVNKQVFKNIGSDLVHYSTAIVKSPARLGHLNTRDIMWAAAFSAATVVLLRTDGGVSNTINPSHAARHTNNVASNILTGGAFAYSGAKYFVGCKRHNLDEKKNALRELEAMGFSLAPTEAIKLSFRRQRPGRSSSDDTFFNGGNSFPSGHAAITAAFATVISEEYPASPWKWAAIGIGAGTPTLRITAKEHFPSDAFVGSTIGILTGRYMCRHCSLGLHGDLPEKDSQPANDLRPAFPDKSSELSTGFLP